MQEVKIFAFADEASSEISGQIAAMKRNQLSGLEIRNVDGENVSDITLEKAREVKRRLEDYDLSVWSIGSPVGKIDIEKDDFAEHTEKLKHTIEVAKVLGAEHIRIFSFYIPEGKEAGIYKEEVLERLYGMCEIAKQNQITLCHENEKGIYGDTPERCLEIYRALPEMRGIFDPANFVQTGVDTLKAWDMLKDYICYMHIKDAQEDGTIVPAGLGAGNIKELAARYREAGGYVFTMEPHLTVFDGLANLERDGEKSSINETRFPNADVAFDTACRAFKKILQ